MQPKEIHDFRDATERKKTMPGVMSPSFVCKSCREVKSIKGRKAFVEGTTRYGYVCGNCKEATK